MLTDTNTYNRELLNQTELQNITEQQIQQELQKYLNKYKHCFTHPHQTKYFQATIQGHLSGLDRKTAKPIALHFLNPTQVRGLQDFYTRPQTGPKPSNKNTKPNSPQNSQTKTDF
ncbi:MAG: hypothetical protein LBE76_06855 [Nitrososphaerota archaeon]|nr:hypothetical protein [Nitrososphaerota archaeon]